MLSNRTAVTTDAPFGTFVGYRVALPNMFDLGKMPYKHRKKLCFLTAK